MRQPPPPAVTEAVISCGTRRLGQCSLPGLGGDQLRRRRGLARDDQRQRAGLLRGRDADSNGVGDNFDCGGFVADGTPDFKCTHRIAIPDGIAQPANFRIVIFSEKSGNDVWNAPVQVITNGKDGKATCPLLHPPANGTTDCTLTLAVGDVVIPVKTPSNGTCSAQNIPDPTTGVNDGIKDMVCQVKTSDQPPLPHGTVFAIVSGFFVDALTGETRAFTARRR